MKWNASELTAPSLRLNTFKVTKLASAPSVIIIAVVEVSSGVAVMVGTEPTNGLVKVML
jgi:hypothetical protein